MTGADFRDFDAEQAEDNLEPVEFGLGGQTFRVPLPLPAAPWFALVRVLVEYDKVSENHLRIIAWWDYVNAALADDDAVSEDDGTGTQVVVQGSSRDRFAAAFTRSKRQPAGIVDVGQHILAESTGRPTQPPTPSESGSSPTGDQSEAEASSPAPGSTPEA